MHFKVMSQHVIVISSFQTAAELFEKRGTIYSDRFSSVMMHDLTLGQLSTSWVDHVTERMLVDS